MIPKIIHFVWIGNPMPWWVEYNISVFSSLNPDYKIMVHDTGVILNEFKRVYSRVKDHHLHRWAMRSDVLRVCALLRYGGWYFDTDFLPFQPVDAIERDYNGITTGFFIVRAGEKKFCANGIIGATKNSAGLSQMAKNVLSKEKQGKLEWWTLGTQCASEVFRQHPRYVTIGEKEMFLPGVIERSNSVSVYKDILENDNDCEYIKEKLGFLPYMIHLHAQDENDLDKIV